MMMMPKEDLEAVQIPKTYNIIKNNYIITQFELYTHTTPIQQQCSSFFSFENICIHPLWLPKEKEPRIQNSNKKKSN